MSERKYYHAYDDRYRQVHEKNLRWMSEEPSPIVAETIREFAISRQAEMLELGCGEGRDAIPLLRQGYGLLATDISPEAIAFCQKEAPEYAAQFCTLDCVSDKLDLRFDFIFAIAVLHMLVPDEDRNAFYSFIRSHLKAEGIALIGTMGDGVFERQSDIRTAFDLQERIHEQTGTPVQIAGTSCRTVSSETFDAELKNNGLAVIRQGITAVEPDFPQMMFAVVKRA